MGGNDRAVGPTFMSVMVPVITTCFSFHLTGCGLAFWPGKRPGPRPGKGLGAGRMPGSGRGAGRFCCATTAQAKAIVKQGINLFFMVRLTGMVHTLLQIFPFFKEMPRLCVALCPSRHASET